VELKGSGYKFTDAYVRTLSGKLDRELAEWAGVTSDDLDACERGMRLAIQESNALVSHRAKRRNDVLSEEGMLSLSSFIRLKLTHERSLLTFAFAENSADMNTSRVRRSRVIEPGSESDELGMQFCIDSHAIYSHLD
jgi:hypothetical protein